MLQPGRRSTLARGRNRSRAGASANLRLSGPAASASTATWPLCPGPKLVERASTAFRQRRHRQTGGRLVRVANKEGQRDRGGQDRVGSSDSSGDFRHPLAFACSYNPVGELLLVAMPGGKKATSSNHCILLFLCPLSLMPGCWE